MPFRSVVTVVFVALAFRSAAAFELGAELFLIDPGAEGSDEEASSLADKRIYPQGSFALASYPGSETYRGVPWRLRVELGDERQARVVFWLNDDNFQLDPGDEVVIDQAVDLGGFEALSLPLYEFDEGARLLLNLSPRPVPPALEPVALEADAFGLNFLCLKRSAIVVDNAFFLSSVSGFGRNIKVRIPGLADVTMSLVEFEEADWEPIGTYEHGLIEVDLGSGHLLSVHGARYGPEGSDMGGPFTVFGAVRAPSRTVDEARDSLELMLGQFDMAPARQTVLLEAARTSPYGGLTGVTVEWGELGPQLERAASRFGRAAPCPR